MIDHLVEQRRRQPERGDALIADKVGQILERRGARRKDDQLAAVQQRTPELERRGVERNRSELQKHLIGPQRDVIRVPHQPYDRTVLDAGPFGLSRRPGSINHVRQVIGPRRDVWVFPVPLGDSRPIRVQANHLGILGWQPVEQASLGQKDGRTCVFDHERQSLRRRLRIQRHISPPRLQDPQHSNDHLQRPLHAEPDHHVGSDAALDEIMCKPVRPLVQFTVRKLPVAKDDRHRLGRPGGLSFEQLVDCGVAWVGSLRAAPLSNHSVAFRPVHQRQP